LDAFQRDLLDLLPRLRRFARTLTRDVADADDLVQVALERACEQRSAWRDGTRIDSWMFTITKNAWNNETRTRERCGGLAGSGEAIETVADPGMPDLEARRPATAAERALLGLPDDQRLAVCLVLGEGLSYREAADVMEVSIGTLTSRLVRGRAALMAELGPGG
jgi:RNA polymerase sigma-70 factor (ECF subfamily)